MVSAYLQMAETSPNVYAFVTRHCRRRGRRRPAVPSRRRARWATSSTPSADMIARPMRSHLGADKEAVIGYWPNAAIGLVRNAGEQWLGSPASPPSRTRKPWRGRSRTGCASGIAPELRRINPASSNDPQLSEPKKEST